MRIGVIRNKYPSSEPRVRRLTVPVLVGTVGAGAWLARVVRCSLAGAVRRVVVHRRFYRRHF